MPCQKVHPSSSCASKRLQFANGDALHFYACSVRQVDPNLDAVYDWRDDVMAPQRGPARARKKLCAAPAMLVCDALLDQDIFAGVGNIIKNEVLFRIRLHPLSQVGDLPARKLRELVEQARQYSFDFLEWKKQGVLKKNWLAHTKTVSHARAPQYVRLSWYTAVVPLTSWPTMSSGLPLGDLSAAMNVRPSGPRSPVTPLRVFR